ncbi:hypothetical protein [Streptomyces sp. AK02-01A]|uniref:hypothetical protein n=1 Tax=Streptomyces sp. AK02-01A TaxID=3028648 RepID=UPI0029B16A2C|nr:hypothetical protein [Streptomyces sp. AK02-01A]MDX3852300.1 hypothetical protein [Streptomyces sp. AK02-01A]
MTKVRSLWPRRRGGKTAKNAAVPPDTSGPEARITPTDPADCLRACALHGDRLVAGDDRKRTELAGKLRHLRTVQDSAQNAAGGREASGAGGQLDGELLDALLAVGTKAMECGDGEELRLALLITDTVLTQRKASRAAWRLRARTLEALGDETAAIEAYERYLELTTEDRFGVAPRLAGLRIAARRQGEMLQLLARACPPAESFAGGPADDLWAEGIRLHTGGEREQAEPRLVGALLAMGRAGRPVLELQNAVGQYLDLRMEGAGGDASALSELIGHYAEQRRNRMRPPLADPTFGGVDWISLGELRNLITGKSVCLVANSESLGRSALGPEIDAYDLVVRFSSYRIDAAATGSRTDIHATSHEHGHNWDRPVTTRIVYGGASEEWRYSLRERLVSGAQRYVADESLRWPLRHIGGIGWDAWPSVPTSGFNTLWLLDFLDVSPTLDLIGFDFYESGVHRLPGAMRVPLTSERERAAEKAWVMERAQSVTDMRISLR